jgi:AcrR family transcriptional regulator
MLGTLIGPRPISFGEVGPQTGVEERILDAADQLLAQRGYPSITMDDLAATAGVAKSTIYQRFQSKEHVVLCHVDRIVRNVINRLEQIASSDASPAKKIRRMLVARVMIRFESVQHYTESLTELLRDVRGSLLGRRERYFQEEAEIFARVIVQGERSNTFRRVDPEATARTLITATNSLLPFSLSAREVGMPRTTEEMTGRVADLLLAGLMNPQKMGGNPPVY